MNEARTLTNIEPLDPADDASRVAAMWQFLWRRTWFCLCPCDLIFKFHVDKECVLQALLKLVNEGQLRVEKKWLEELDHDDGRADPGWDLYLAKGKLLEDPKNLQEVTLRAAKVACAAQILRECFPGYQPGIRLDAQGQIGQRVGKALSAAVETLSSLGAVPVYWPKVRLNTTAIVFTLQEVFGDAAEVRSLLSFLWEVQDPQGFDTVMKEIECEAKAIAEPASKATASLEAALDRLEEVLAR
jgi:hypothetical protein